MKRRQTTTFYIETLVLIAILIMVILILTRIFGMGRAQSQEARRLTSAVSLAQDAAEAVSACASPEELTALLNTDGNAAMTGDNRVTARYDSNMQPDPEGLFCVQIHWDPEEMLSGSLVNCHMEVLYAQEAKPVYTLDTAVFLHAATVNEE